MQTLFYISHENEQMGPFSVEDIENKISKNELHLTDYVYIEAVEDWVLMSDFLRDHSKASVVKTPPPSQPSQQVVSTEAKPETEEVFEIEVDDEDTNFEIIAEEAPTEEAPQVIAPATQETPDNEPVTEAPMVAEVTPATETEEDRADSPAPETATASEPSSPAQMTNGKGQWNWSTQKMGHYNIVLSVESADGKLRTINQELEVLAGPAKKLRWSTAGVTTVDQTQKLFFSALDQYGNENQDYQGTVEIETPSGDEVSLNFVSGKAVHEIECQKAGAHEVKIKNSELEFEGHPVLEFLHGEFHSVELSNAEAVRAGDQVELQIRAIDKYGNTVENFKGQVTVQIDDQIHSVSLPQKKEPSKEAG